MTGNHLIIIKALKKNKSITLALIVSLILHLFIANKFAFNNKTPDTTVKILSVQIVNTAKLQLSSSSEFKKETLESPSTTQTPNTPIDKNLSEVVVNTENVISEPLVETVSTLESTSVEDLTQAEKIVAKKSNTGEPNQTVNNHDSLEVATSKNYITPIYRYIEAVYEAHNSNTSGNTRVMFNLDKNNTYTINEFTSWSNVADSSLTTKQMSNGSITDFGLVSSHYSYQDSTGNNNKNILFDWAENSVIFQDSNRQRTATLPTNTYDALNYLFQFMFFDPSSENIFIIAKTDGLQATTCQLIGEESLITMVDELKTIHLQCNESDAKSDIWLAKDLQNFPVKLLKVDNTYNITQQLIIKSIATAKRE